MNPLPPATPELIEKVLLSENKFSRALEVSRLAGNPYGVKVENFEGAKAILFTKGRFRSKSRVSGGIEAIAKHLPKILKLYHTHGLPCQVQLSSHIMNMNVISRLIDCGLKAVSTGVTLIGRPEHYYVDNCSNVRIEEWDKNRIEDYLDLFLEADEVPFEARNDIRDFEYCEYQEPGIQFFVAFWEDVPVAASTVVIDGCIGRLKSAATLPNFRRKGCQTALLKARFDFACKKSCEYMSVGTSLYSASHRNMERFGMKILSFNTAWKSTNT